MRKVQNANNKNSYKLKKIIENKKYWKTNIS